MSSRQASGHVHVRSPANVVEVDGSIVIDFGTDSGDIEIDLNGRRFAAETPTALANALEADVREQATRVITITYDVTVEGDRMIITSDVVTSDAGASLAGPDAQAAVDKAAEIVGSARAWPMAPSIDAPTTGTLDALTGDGGWDGPLVVSMPRTGSTLMGMLLLLCRDNERPSGYRFDRYIHEPAAPLFWRGDDLQGVTDFISALTDGDVVQESAYQFAHPDVARWFVSHAKQPVVFTMRHPQLAWPSRWRIMLAKMLAETPDDPEAAAAGAALESDDFSELGNYLTQRVRPADNGFYAFVSLMDMCNRESIEFVIVDNTRFRERPDATLRTLCHRLGTDFDPNMTRWTDLEAVLPRVAMTDLALGEEYQWYYADTLGSQEGIQTEIHELIDPSRVPEQLRGTSDAHLTIDEAVTWYQLLLNRPETLP